MQSLTVCTGNRVELNSRSIAQALVFTLLAGYALAATVAVAQHWYFQDADAYWLAAQRLRDGQPLYVTALDPAQPQLYRYAPWFAYLWVPLTYLPHPLVMALWAAVLACAGLWLIRPLWTPAGVALALLCFPDLLRVTSTGNVQPLLLAGIAYGLTSRWGPLILGAAASLKGWPLAFALWWWDRRVLYAVAVAAVLIAPVALYDLSAYPTSRQLWTPGMLSAALIVMRGLSSGRTAPGWRLPAFRRSSPLRTSRPT